ncbi:uncharacterized protein LOC131164432 [Malania oleifera]|uniref:uncharacterized protein LOC131164432 n=1 Tax=Malania oleifera TaxID=397392 RepID=UPI0025ADA61E|nr:uncharacterized protein LOC131164432 [Malania oleifera]
MVLSVRHLWKDGLVGDYGVIASATTISAYINSILVLNSSNFKSWKENVMIVLNYMNLDLVLWTERPPALTDTRTFDMKRDLERWDHSNCMSLMIMKHDVLEAFRGSMSNKDDAKVFLEELHKHFAKNEKAEISNLLSSLVSMRYKG